MARKTCCLAMLLGLLALPARADFFALEMDGQAGYLRLDNIERPASTDKTTLSGVSFGVRGKLEILFISVLVDYQHLINNADFLHAGLGADIKLPLGIVKPFVRGSVGLILLAASEGAFSPRADTKLEPTAGFQARAGGGLEIPLGDWFAVGAGVDVGYHYLTGNHGWDLSVSGFLGLRI